MYPQVRPVPPTSTHRRLGRQRNASRDPKQLTWRQIAALVRAANRELTWTLGAVAQELAVMRAGAHEIPEPEIRRDAIRTLDTKRGHIDGAALFTTLPARRNRSLLRILVAYEFIWDFLDTVNEHGAQTGQANGRQLHLALIDALDAARPISDYYKHHPWKDDGGYLRGLVETCRRTTADLPSYDRVQPMLIEEATRAQVLAINHELLPTVRDHALKRWAADQPPIPEVEWFELSGAASASLAVHALLALAAEPAASTLHITRTRSAYSPWISAATTMLDSYVDQAEDQSNGDHSYVAHYPTPQIAARRAGQLTRRSLAEARVLPHPERHILIIACMAAMYLSKDSARTPALRSTTRDLTRAGGSLTQLLRPILRLWRIAYAQRKA